MSRLTELLGQVAKADAALAADLRREVEVLSSRRPFGLNFERHVPESVELPSRTIRRGDKVVFRDAGGVDRQPWIVVGFQGKGAKRKAKLIRRAASDEQDETEAPLTDLVVVAEFRDTIYPGLRSTGVVEQAENKPYHAVINGENYHVLQALTFVCRGEVDCIYIDPPYNSGARDWKYNNDYVDGEDAYRHSKWLAMMERRLLIAKELLNPDDSVLIVTIDEKEYRRLGLLLEQLFPNDSIQMISTVINPSGSPRRGHFSRVDEYIFFVYIGAAHVVQNYDDMLHEHGHSRREVRWDALRRRGAPGRRSERPNLFYPIYFKKSDGTFHSVGEPLAADADRAEVKPPKGTVAVFPLTEDGQEMRWGLKPDTVSKLHKDGFIRFGEFKPDRNQQVAIYHLQAGSIRDIASGEISVLGHDSRGAVIAEYAKARALRPMSVWNRASHSAGDHGATLLSKFLPGRHFPFPKSLYAVEDALRFFVGDKPDALILDFFAGSGTTTHAVMRLNRQDGGRRRSIMVTNNEASAEEALDLREKGRSPGDPEWEELGVCEHITKPRIRAAITGKTPADEPIRGDYKFVDEFPIVDGFEENAEFFDLTYEDPERVRYGLGFEAIAPLLWLRAGAEGVRLDSVEKTFAVADHYAVLFDLDAAAGFVAAVRSEPALRVAYVMTDDETQFQVVTGQLPHNVESIRLYAAYLDNFRIRAGA